jgi:hypothetical protein
MLDIKKENRKISEEISKESEVSKIDQLANY